MVITIQLGFQPEDFTLRTWRAVANVWDDHWIYWLGPLIGAAIAALTYEFVFLQREEEEGQ